MNPETLLQWMTKYGISFVFAALSVVGLYRLTLFVLKENAKREERLAGLIEQDLVGLQKTLQVHDDRSASAIESIKQANGFQREEHQRMLEALTELTVTLRRINGTHT